MAGIYVHIPFCKHRCTYCDFHFSTNLSRKSDMTEAILQEATYHSPKWKDVQINTVYFGGGTPSILTDSELSQITEGLRERFQIDPKAEWTLEANPDDILPAKLKVWKQLGFNRLSIGIQSFQKEQLEWMNRAHDVNQALKCIPLAQDSGFENLTADLIYGLPNLPLSIWEKDLETMSQFQVPHLSAYILTVEERTALHHLVNTEQMQIPEDKHIEQQYQVLCSWAKSQGLEHYEVSNFALPRCRSKHNSNYWNRTDYLGLGPSAHSFQGNKRWWNISNNHQYIRNWNQGEPSFETEVLSEQDVRNEQIMVGLRRKEGILLEQVPHRESKEKLSEFEKKGWIKRTDSSIQMTESGWLMSDYVAGELFF